YVRLKSAESLGKTKDARAVEPLIQALKDEDAYIRRAAAKALVRIGQPAMGPLLQALKDEGSRVRQKAAWALIEMRNRNEILPGTVEMIEPIMQVHKRWLALPPELAALELKI
ncbi:unnamed protein product, partial [marine sediment metagenome]